MSSVKLDILPVCTNMNYSIGTRYLAELYYIYYIINAINRVRMIWLVIFFAMLCILRFVWLCIFQLSHGIVNLYQTFEFECLYGIFCLLFAVMICFSECVIIIIETFTQVNGVCCFISNISALRHIKYYNFEVITAYFFSVC